LGAVAGYARRRGLALRVFTNGIALSRETAGRLAALVPMAVEVSIFSLAPERHDAVTGVPGSLRRALRGMARLRRAGVPLVVKCPLLSQGGGDHAAVRRLAERLGADLVFDPQILPALDGGAAPTRCRGEDALVEGYFADEATRRHDRPEPPTPPDRAPCAAGRTFLVVSPDGEVRACPVMPVAAGNVRSAPLEVIWRDAPVFRRLRAMRFGDLAACGACPRSGYCQRCSALALLEDGDLEGPSSRACRMAELRERAWGIPAPPGAPAPRKASLRVIPG
jgi:radical SAM protein with 4Fe4S-binding SPASM domain